MEMATKAVDAAREGGSWRVVGRRRRDERSTPTMRQQPNIDMHALGTEYEQYAQANAINEANEAYELLQANAVNATDGAEMEEMVVEEAMEGSEASRQPLEADKSGGWLSVTLESDEEEAEERQDEDEDEEDKENRTERARTDVSKSDEISELDLFLHRRKFTTSAVSFFLARVRESTIAAGHAVSASAHGPPPPLPTPPGPLAPWPPLSEYEIERRSRKARRPPPPPGCLPSPSPRGAEARSPSFRSRGSAPIPNASAPATTLPAAEDCSSRNGGCAWFCPLERRLEQELEAARAREMALHAALKQRREALSESDEASSDGLTSGPTSPLATRSSHNASKRVTDGPRTYRERRVIEEWLMSQSLARSRPRRANSE